MSLEILSSGVEGGPVYDAGRWLIENHDRLGQSFDPSVTPIFAGAGVAGLAVAGGVLWAAPVGVKAGRMALRRHLTGRPGDVVLGFGRGERHDWLLNPPVFQRLADRFTHTQVVGPTRQGKTTLLLSLAAQDLASRLSVFSIEVSGDFAYGLSDRAGAAGRPVYLFDCSHPETSVKWNPLAGDPIEAAERTVSAMLTVGASSEEFFRQVNTMVLREVVYTAIACSAHIEEEATLDTVFRFLTDMPYRNRALGLSRPDKDSPARLTTPALDGQPDTRRWWETVFFGIWTDRQRYDFTTGLQAAIKNLLGNPVAKEMLCPKPGERQVRLEEALAQGSAVIFRVSQGAVGEVTARFVGALVLQHFQQATLERRGVLYPVMAYLDEVHLLLGDHNSPLARSFAGWLPAVGKYNVAVTAAYQGFGMVDDHLMQVFENNLRNKIVFGGLGDRDARIAQAMMGFEEREVRDVRTTRSAFSPAPRSVSVGKREMSRPRWEVWDIRAVPRGRALFQAVVNGGLQEPRLVEILRSPNPGGKTRDGRTPARKAVRRARPASTRGGEGSMRYEAPEKRPSRAAVDHGTREHRRGEERS